MTKPLALIYYSSLMPGSRLVNRLQDLGYRVQVLSDAQGLVNEAAGAMPLVVLVDLSDPDAPVCEVIRRLRERAETAHIPVLAFGSKVSAQLQSEAVTAGATLVAASSGMLAQLPQLLGQVLEV